MGTGGNHGVGVPVALSWLCSFVFLQLYHSPFFGDESNKPILLPSEVCLHVGWTLGLGWAPGSAQADFSHAAVL